MKTRRESLPRAVVQHFTRLYGAPPAALVRAPGRVNLIGEHTDYNEGFVLPLAIDRGVWIALSPRDDYRVVARSLLRPETVDFSLPVTEPHVDGWGRYLQGVGWALNEAGHTLKGWQGLVASDLPVGAGLSSSAALEMACARAFAFVSGIAWDATEMARIGQRAENAWVGVNCGIMDQLACAAGVADHALLIDCRSLQIEPVPLPDGTAVVILDTGTRRGLIGSAYNERRDRCEAAARHFGVRALRDVDARRFFEPAEQRLDDVTHRRARHVVTENARTLAAAQEMRQGDARAVGRLMNESHESLRLDFEVSSGALDVMVECARRQESCFGARMTGAGFGGCAVALVNAGAVAEFTPAVARCYHERAGNNAQIYVCRAANGAEVLAPV